MDTHERCNRFIKVTANSVGVGFIRPAVTGATRSEPRGPSFDPEDLRTEGQDRGAGPGG